MYKREASVRRPSLAARGLGGNTGSLALVVAASQAPVCDLHHGPTVTDAGVCFNAPRNRRGRTGPAHYQSKPASPTIVATAAVPRVIAASHVNRRLCSENSLAIRSSRAADWL